VVGAGIEGGRSVLGMLVAKATFRFDSNGKVSLDEQEPLRLLDEDQQTPLGVLPADVIARRGPRFEVMLLGHAYGAGRRSVPKVSVALSVGHERREMLVFGDPAGPISLGSATDWAWKATLGDSPKMWAIKAGAGLAVNAARLFIADGDGSLSLSVGPGGYWGASAGFSRSDGVWSFSASASAGTASPVGPSVGGQKSWQHTWNKDGSTTTTSSSTAASGAPIGPGGVAAQQTSSTSTTKDAAGKDTSTSESKTTQVVAGEPFVGGSRVSSESTTTPTGGTPQKSSSGHQGGNAFGNTWGETL
jgi:hypothetical protein